MSQKLMKLSLLIVLSFSSLIPFSVIRAEECKVLTATGNAEYPPYLWRKGDGTKELLGANAIVMAELGKRLGITIELQDVGSWARAQDMLKTGRIDLIAGAFFTVPRIQYMDYVYPAFLDTKSVVWRKPGSDTPYSSRGDLVGLKGVTVINNSFGQEFDEYAQKYLNLSYVASLKQAFMMVSRDRADFVLYEKNPGLAYSELFGFAGELDVLEPAISSEGLYLTVSHRSACNTGLLRGGLAKEVQGMIADGFMSKALQQGLDDWKAFTR